MSMWEWECKYEYVRMSMWWLLCEDKYVSMNHWIYEDEYVKMSM